MYLIEGKREWLETEDAARVNLQKVDLLVESGTAEVYDQFERDMMRRVCEKMS